MSRYVLAIFLGTMTVCAVALAWLGGQVLEQDRTLETHRAQERLEHAADYIAATFARKLAEMESQQPMQGVVEIRGRGNAIDVVPPHGLLYLPVAAANQDADAGVFAAGEALEFHRNDPNGAAAAYRALARSSDPAVQAGALLRLGRALRNAGRDAEALAAYRELLRMDSTPVLGVPAGVTALTGLCSTLEAMGKRDELRHAAAEFYGYLMNGRWPMPKTVWEFHVGEARRWSGAGPFNEHDGDRIAIAGAAEWLDAQWRNGAQTDGRRIVEIDNLPVLVSWKSEERELHATIAGPSTLRAIWTQALAGQHVDAALVDADGRIALGVIGKNSPQAVRTPSATALPWIVQVSSAGSYPSPTEGVRRRELLLAGFGVVGLVLLAGSFFILYAMARERAVARLQSDFVSTVSHEFRTPLTTLLQLSDMLDKDRISAENMRREAYRVMFRESERLQRLVESLLDFGRLEAKSFRYRLENVDASEVIQHVVDEFRSKATLNGYEVELGEAGDRPVVRADREALGLAVWNLLDNAVKYSPECRTVWVEVARENGRVAIRVRDRGMGIATHEQKRIFRKFVRGKQPAEKQIKGTGIGLAITRRIVEAHRGEIRLRSEPGQGSTFTILLPSEQNA